MKVGFISTGVSIWFRESHFRSKTLFLSQKEPKPLKKVEKDVIFSKRRAQHFQRILPIKKAPFLRCFFFPQKRKTRK